jgi:hypothetical protein
MSYTEPTKPTPNHTEPSKSDVNYGEPQWLGATWKMIAGWTWEDMAGITWKMLWKLFGHKVDKPTYTEKSKGTVSYTEPSKE